MQRVNEPERRVQYCLRDFPPCLSLGSDYLRELLRLGGVAKLLGALIKVLTNSVAYATGSGYSQMEFSY
jgi:hypothetical protein